VSIHLWFFGRELDPDTSSSLHVKDELSCAIIN
jgi:hypothetical protein